MKQINFIETTDTYRLPEDYIGHMEKIRNVQIRDLNTLREVCDRLKGMVNREEIPAVIEWMELNEKILDKEITEILSIDAKVQYAVFEIKTIGI